MDTISDLNESFLKDWEKNRGPEQTEFFMDLIWQYLPMGITEEIAEWAESILDAGCATGEGAVYLSRRFPKAQIVGMDLSDVAIQKAAQKHHKKRAHVNFLCCSLEKAYQGKYRYDAVFCSNVLEHFEDPNQQFYYLVGMAKQYLVLLTPFEEIDRIPGHRCTITRDTFPEHILEDWTHKPLFSRIHQEVIDTSQSQFWGGKQILQVYKALNSLPEP